MELAFLSAMDVSLLVLAWVFCTYTFARAFWHTRIIWDMGFFASCIVALHLVLFLYSLASPLLITRIPGVFFVNSMVLGVAVTTFLNHEFKWKKVQKNG